MKTRILAAVVLTAAVGAPARAGLVASETFDYGNGALQGKTGWSGSWTSNAGSVATGQYVITGQNNSNAAVRTLASGQTGPLYFSFKFSFTGTPTNNDFAALWFDNGTGLGSDHTGGPNVGLKGQAAPNQPDFFARLSGTGGAYHPTQLVAGVDYLIVGKLEKTAGAGAPNFNKMTLWVDPTLETAASITTTGNGNVSTISRVGFRTANLGASDTVTFDDLRIGTDFASVTAVPVPPVAVLAAGALVGLPLIRRVRKYA